MITFVCGQLCSGKTRYAKAMAGSVAGLFIEVGDIVREIKNTSERRELQNSKELHETIVKQLKYKIHLRDELDITNNYVICGVRQKEILEHFPEATLLWIECPKKERKKRYKQRARQGDAVPFKEAEQGDINLGILGVKKYILKQ
jgi:cytidylate kinase